MDDHRHDPDHISRLHARARELHVITWARDLCNCAVDDWSGCLAFVVEVAELERRSVGGA